MSVRILHNVEGSGRSFADGYQPGDKLAQVFEFEQPSDLFEPLEVLEFAFYAFNVGDEEGVPVALDYRGLRLRSLSVGDVVVIGDAAWACASLGWTKLDAVPEG